MIRSAASWSIPRLFLPASTMSAGKCNSLEKLSNRRIRNLRQVLYLRRRWTTARIAAAVLNMICSAYSAPGRRKVPGLTLSFCYVH